MPTGYTSTLVEKGQTFEEFVLTCARAIDYLAIMRDDPLNTPIPEFKPDKYDVEQAEKAPKRLVELLNLSETQRVSLGLERKKEAIENSKNYLKKSQEENKRLEEMEQKVLAWTPPTSEHNGLKEFMLQQIDISKNTSDYAERQLEKVKGMSAIAFFEAELRSAERDVTYYEDHLAKEIKNTEERNKWVKELKESLK